MTKETIKRSIMRMVAERGNESSCCPSEIARELEPKDWRALMPRVREVADELRSEGHIVILQKNKQIASAVKAIGPIRLRQKFER